MILTFTGENVGTLCHIGGLMESDIKYALSTRILQEYPKGDYPQVPQRGSSHVGGRLS